MANQTFREEMADAWQYWCFRAKYSVSRPWYFRVLAFICRRCEK